MSYKEFNFNLSEQYALSSSVIPELTFSKHKGQCGRIGVIGGCKEYTGAPYFAAISSLKTGCDLSFVFCTKDSAPVIKSYSPELMVYPLLDDENAGPDICQILPRLHSLVIGPGLGRDPKVLPVLQEVIFRARELGLPIVFDADGLHHLAFNLDLVKGYKSAILTPNMAEFCRLSETVFKIPVTVEAYLELVETVANVASALGNVTIVLKQQNDIITDGNVIVRCTEPGSPRRCGGQGDLLSGSMGTFNFWSHQYVKELPGSSELSATILAALGACLLTKRCSRMAFESFGRSMTTSDMIAQIRIAFRDVFSKD